MQLYAGCGKIDNPIIERPLGEAETGTHFIHSTISSIQTTAVSIPPLDNRSDSCYNVY